MKHYSHGERVRRIIELDGLDYASLEVVADHGSTVRVRNRDGREYEIAKAIIEEEA